MALARTLLEQLTCPVCQDLYSQPMVLKCHHSLCTECLQGVKSASRVPWKVECPVCRVESQTETITPDFRMVTLLEAHQVAQTSVTSTPDSGGDDYDMCDKSGLRLCDLCRKEPVRQKCRDCDKLFCHHCSKNHKTLPTCHGHELLGLGDMVDKERASLTDQRDKLLKEDKKVEEKHKEITQFKASLDEVQVNAIGDINQWYEGIVAQAVQQRDGLILKTQRLLDAERSGLVEKERIVSEKQRTVKESLGMIQTIQTEDNPAKVLGSIDALRDNLDQRALEDSPSNVKHIVIPNVPSLRISVGKRWDETKAIRLTVKKQGVCKVSSSMVTFPSNLSTARFSRHKDIEVASGTKQILVQRGHLWCLYDDHIDIYDTHGSLYKTVTGHINIPNGFASLPNGNVVVACMSMGLVEFTTKGKFVEVIAEGSMCDVSADNKLVYSLDYTDSRPVLKAFRKKHFRWRKVLDRQLQNDKCNTFNTLLTNQSSVFVSATEENILVEYTRDGELMSRFSGPRATRLCASDTWGNVLLTNHENDEVWLFKNDQSWHLVDVEGVTKPYGVAVDEDGGLWVSNTTCNVTRYNSQGNTLNNH